MSTGLSGVDLARQALVHSPESVEEERRHPAVKPQRRTGTTVRHDDRAPLPLGVPTTMMTERSMADPAASRGFLARFDGTHTAAAPGCGGARSPATGTTRS
ncbi:hypothetical protein [Streptomyces eurythermus]